MCLTSPLQMGIRDVSRLFRVIAKNATLFLPMQLIPGSGHPGGRVQLHVFVIMVDVNQPSQLLNHSAPVRHVWEHLFPLGLSVTGDQACRSEEKGYQRCSCHSFFSILDFLKN